MHIGGGGMRGFSGGGMRSFSAAGCAASKAAPFAPALPVPVSALRASWDGPSSDRDIRVPPGFNRRFAFAAVPFAVGVYGGSCWRWRPGPWGWQRVWVCGYDYSYGYY